MQSSLNKHGGRYQLPAIWTNPVKDRIQEPSARTSTTRPAHEDKPNDILGMFIVIKASVKSTNLSVVNLHPVLLGLKHDYYSYYLIE